ncbi:MAG: rhodanese-like domain-containing protein [Planctomycetota bacterium]
MTTLIRILAIVGAASLLGAGHLLTRSTAIVLRVDMQPVPADAVTDLPGEPALAQPEPLEPIEPVEDAGGDAPPAADPTAAGEANTERAAPAISTGVRKIGLAEAATLFNQGAAFIDARTEREFAEGRIYGAFWMPAQRVFTEAGQNDLDFVDPSLPVVVYCTGGECDASENTIARIRAAGYDWPDIRIMQPGYDDWLAAGLPVETGSPGEGDQP